MPPRKAGPPIPDPYSVEYAPTGRAACQKCKGLIGQDTVRFCRKVHSPWHDGFDTKFYHLKCGLDYVEDIWEITGWHGLKWKDVLSCARKFDIELDESHPVIEKYKLRSSQLWKLTEQLSEIQSKVLKSILSHNDIEFDSKVNAAKAASFIADRLLFGDLPRCPICHVNALHQIGCEVICRGFIETTKCNFKFMIDDLLNPDSEADNSSTGVDEKDIQRGAPIAIPPDCMNVPFFKSWKPPAGAARAAPAADKTGSKTNPPRPAKAAPVKFDSEDEDPETVPKRQELLDMVFSSVGKTVPSKAELVDIVEAHGGDFVDDIDTNTTFLLVGSDPKHYKTTARFKAAQQLGVPVLNVDYLTALTRRTNVLPKPRTSRITSSKKREQNEEDESDDQRPQGLILRQRKFAKHYLVSGKIHNKMRPVADTLEQKRLDRSKERGVMRPPLRPGSALLQVDEEYPGSGTIYVDEMNNAYNATTMFSDVQTGLNSFFTLQLIKSNSSQAYNLLRKWGRIGAEGSLKNGSLVMKFDSDLSGALAKFHSKFFELTGVDWNERFTERKPGRHRYVDLEGHVSKEEGDSTTATEKAPSAATKSEESSPARQPMRKESELHETLQALISLICDRRMMEQSMADQQLDVGKMPLGSISQQQMQRGYAALQSLQSNLLSRSESGDTSAPSLKWTTTLTSLTNEFYVAIPHVFTLQQTPPVIDSLPKLRSKIEIMEQLLEIATADSLISAALKDARELNPIDVQYESLGCRMQHVPKGSRLFSFTARHLQRCHGGTHTGFKVSLQDMYECIRGGEDERFAFDLPDRRMLWHGSRLTNWVGILSQGLRCAPPEAPTSGYMFDKGIYFADVPSKSCQYCYADQNHSEGLLVLCEVALGRPHMRLESQGNAKARCAKRGLDHTWGVGRYHPCPTFVNFRSPNRRVLSSDFEEVPFSVEGTADEDESMDAKQLVKMANGKVVENAANLRIALESPEAGRSEQLLYNEYIVYDVCQVRLRYLARIRFKWQLLDEDDDGDTSSSDASSSSP